MRHDQTISPPESQRRLVQAFARVLAAQGQAPVLYETHISWVLVTPRYAWKLKKALQLPFIDTASLQARRHYCEEELRLNRRTAPDLYLAVEALRGPAEAPLPGRELDADDVLEYAVRMKSFDNADLWDSRIANHLLTMDECALMGASLGQFHQQASAATADSPWGRPEALLVVSRDNRAELQGLLPPPLQGELAGLGQRMESLHQATSALRGSRRQDGRVRECHGDLHCGNLLTLDGHPLAFDCIDFDPALRWLDVADDLAFAWMDLHAHGLPLHASCLLDAWLQETGDFACLPLLALGGAEKALVRCKVGLLRALQQESAQAALTRDKSLAYFSLAQTLLQPTNAGLPPVILMHGFSGSGKSVLAAALARATGAVRLRSDVERKRAPANTDLYTEQARHAVYAHMGAQLAFILQAGLLPIVDAAFLDEAERARFSALATSLGTRALIVDCVASADTLRQRLRARKQAGKDPSDADIAVLEQQLRTHRPLSAEETARSVRIDTARGAAPALALAQEAATGLGLLPHRAVLPR